VIVAVTGGSGFIGKRLVERLIERGDTVRLLTRGPVLPEIHPLLEIHQCDLVMTSVGKLSSILDGVDVLYHCAGQLTDKQAMRALHVDATRMLVEAASQRIDHWVQLSSVGVYGPVHQGAIDEEKVGGHGGSMSLRAQRSNPFGQRAG